LVHTDLYSAGCLHGADLSFADPQAADLHSADLHGANLSDDLSGVKGLTREQLEETCGIGVYGFDKLDPPLDPPPTMKRCPERPK
jgi:pentapeptide repeat protein